MSGGLQCVHIASNKMLSIVTARNNAALLRPCTLPFQFLQIMPSTFDSDVIPEVFVLQIICRTPWMQSSLFGSISFRVVCRNKISLQTLTL